MQVKGKSAVRRAIGATVIAVAAVGSAALINPAMASAATAAPEVSYTVSGNDMLLTVKNPNTGLFSMCQAFVVNAADLATISSDPTKLLDPEVVVYPNVSNPLTLFAVGAGDTLTNPVDGIPNGLYAVIGACVDPLEDDGLTPTVGLPSVVLIGGPLSGFDTSSLSGGESGIGGAGSLELVTGLFGL